MKREKRNGSKFLFSVMYVKISTGSGNMKINYQLKLDAILSHLPKEKKATLLLHSCCGPCSSYVLEYLENYFEITVFYYNPNITNHIEYQHRVEEQKRLIELAHPNVHFLEGTYQPDLFIDMSKGLEEEPEGGVRCIKCYYLRMHETIKKAKELGFDYFTTTLSISPYKDSEKLNQIGEMLEQQYGVSYLYADFKKRNGYKRSIELSKQYHLYRQDYCGCEFSKKRCEI